ncbi:MAG: TonB-dependent receptor plug domain-containing protein, partial [Leptospiraceae bacterium]|nr:TonB-dependent receptor plug domain-containing protein [Leptospiraceae bacterium]
MSLRITPFLFFLFTSQILLAQTKKEDVSKTEKIEVIGVKDSSEYEKTRSVKKDPSGFTDVIKLEKAQTRYSSIDEVLEREAGLRVRRYGGLGSYSTLSIRGSNANQVRFFIDGVPINNTMGGEINLADLPFENLEEIEIYKSGTASGFSGSAIGGVVNLVTKKGKKTKSSQVKVAGGSFKTIQVSALHKNFYENLDYTFSVQAEKS